MRVINISCLHKFWQRHPETEECLKTWVCTVVCQSWNDTNDILKVFPRAKLINQTRIRFPFLKGKYYLKADLHYQTKTLTIKDLGLLKAPDSIINLNQL